LSFNSFCGAWVEFWFNSFLVWVYHHWYWRWLPPPLAKKTAISA